MRWWREARFGLFIHFGLFSLPTAEPKRMDKYFSMTDDEFVALKDRFNPVRYDPKEWARLARTAGMKYLVLVTKSHDGWCLFDSKYTDFDVMSTPYRRDILKPLAEACRREGIRICWYYSIMDWHHLDYLPRRSVDKRPAAGASFDRYVVFMKNQLCELLTNYGPIGVLWFDGEWDASWTDQRGEDLYRYVRSLQPDIIVNNRVGKSRRGMTGVDAPGARAGDFGTPEQNIPAAAPTGVDWETCMTMNNHWEYIDYDQNWKSSSTLIHMLVDCASKGANFLLDVGPTPEGPFPRPAVERLEAIGRWMHINGESIHGTQASPYGKPFSWGRCTTKRVSADKSRLYLHVFQWPGDGNLVVPALKNRVIGSFLLADPNRSGLGVRAEGESIRITVPRAAPDPADSVVVLDVAAAP
jgi:alpha-L-fucosidase